MRAHRGYAQRHPGNFLTRTTYSLNADQVAALTAAMAPDPKSLEAYHWKNPALIQREVADVVAESGSKASFRLTAASVLNTGNAPMSSRSARWAPSARPPTPMPSPPQPREYWEVQAAASTSTLGGGAKDLPALP